MRGFSQRHKTPLGIYLSPALKIRQPIGQTASTSARRTRNTIPEQASRQRIYATMLEKWTVPSVVSLKRMARAQRLASKRRITPIKVDDAPFPSRQLNRESRFGWNRSATPNANRHINVSENASPARRAERGQLPNEYKTYASWLRSKRPSQTHSTKLIGQRGLTQSPTVYAYPRCKCCRSTKVRQRAGYSVASDQRS